MSTPVDRSVLSAEDVLALAWIIDAKNRNRRLERIDGNLSTVARALAIVTADGAPVTARQDIRDSYLHVELETGDRLLWPVFDLMRARQQDCLEAF